MKEKDPRWSKQFGDFGEQLVMYVIGQQKGMKVALVDHAGADLIASDLGKQHNRYAISVKSHQLNVVFDEKHRVVLESKLYNFNAKNIKLLKEFSENFDLKPTVALVMVEPLVAQDNENWQTRGLIIHV